MLQLSADAQCWSIQTIVARLHCDQYAETQLLFSLSRSIQHARRVDGTRVAGPRAVQLMTGCRT
ncbi:hypothetical protein REMIM1_PE00246 (plasmid) [Rhizobium etli bv. mimosae str. Mim1]|nr:hypothetical protein REMIM1_PE00246 [Rhizobium etli bv. mimosae str. Mim1]